MGTYTTNYNLFLPSIGEQGWGELVNGNFSTIDAAMKDLGNNIGTLETEINAVEGRVTVLEAGDFETINVVGTINGALYVNASYEDTGIGSYEVVPSSSEISNTVGGNGTRTVSSGDITINDMVYTKKKGFEFNMCPAKLSVSVYGYTGLSSGNLTLALYKNNVLVDSNVANANYNRTTSFEAIVSEGDVICAKGTCAFGANYRDFTVSLTITNGLTGAVYLG